MDFFLYYIVGMGLILLTAHIGWTVVLSKAHYISALRNGHPAAIKRKHMYYGYLVLFCLIVIADMIVFVFMKPTPFY